MNLSNASRSQLSNIPGLNKAIDFICARAQVVFSAQHNPETGAHTAITADSLSTGTLVASGDAAIEGDVDINGELDVAGRTHLRANLLLDPTFAIYFDGGIDTMIREAVDNLLQVLLGGLAAISMDRTASVTRFSLARSNNGTGNVTGNTVSIGDSVDGSGAAGLLELYNRVGLSVYVWQDATGQLRVSSAPPQEDGTPADTSGAVINQGDKSLFERSRTTAVGEWTTFVPTQTAATGTWTGSTITTAQYMRVGKTLFVELSIDAGNNSAGTASLRIAIPGGFVANKAMGMPIVALDLGAFVTDVIATVGAGGTLIVFTKLSNWNINAANGNYVQCSIDFEVQ